MFSKHKVAFIFMLMMNIKTVTKLNQKCRKLYMYILSRNNTYISSFTVEGCESIRPWLWVINNYKICCYDIKIVQNIVISLNIRKTWSCMTLILHTGSWYRTATKTTNNLCPIIIKPHFRVEFNSSISSRDFCDEIGTRWF